MTADTAMDIRLLGPLEVRTAGGRLCPLGGPRQRTLFGLLALRTPNVVSRTQLIDGIWDEEPPPGATKTLHAHVAYLRRRLAAAGLNRSIVTRPPGYALTADADQVDAHRFGRLVQLGRAALGTGAATEAFEALREALQMWRGEVLADCPLGQWARADVAALREARQYAIEDLLAAQLALGQHTAAAAELERLVAQEPLRERLWELLMVALHRCGRQGDALGAYRRARAVLAEELGVEPGAGLRAVEAAILAGDGRLDCGPAPASESVPAGLSSVTTREDGTSEVQEPARPSASMTDLPCPLTNLVGRQAEITELAALLDGARLVTLTGVGGCGKTRLAIAVAGDVAERYDAGVRFVDLTDVGEPEAVPGVVTAVFGLRERPDRTPLDLLADELRRLRLLLVLDNCEHVADACAQLVATLLGRCPGLGVLATSRAPLGPPGEVVWPVPPLSVPADGGVAGLDALRRHDSVLLFLDRAAVPALRGLAEADAPALARICAGLDGLPLALELAAARTSVLTLQEIADRIHDPALLRTSRGGRRSHHRALDATMAWSYGLLDEAMRMRFRRLAVFTGGFTLAAAQAVWPGTSALDTLDELVAKSLVVMERRGAAARYRLLATIRHYAWERLAESPAELWATRRDHAVYYRTLAEESDDTDRLALEQDNLLAALTWYAENGPGADELRFATALARYFHLRGRYREGRRRLAGALSRSVAAPPGDLARALVSIAYLALFECDYAAAADHGERGLALHRSLGDRQGTAHALALLASVDRERGHYARSRALCEEAVVVYREEGNEAGVADARQMAGFAAWLAGDLVAAERLVTDAVRRFQLLGDAEGIGSARVHLAAVALYRGEPARARWLAEDSLARFRKLDFQEGIAWALNILGLVAHADGEPEHAAEALGASLEIHATVGDRWRSASVLEALATVLAPRTPARAAELLATASTIRDSIGAPVPPQERAAVDATLATVRSALGDREFYAARARGEAARIGMQDGYPDP